MKLSSKPELLEDHKTALNRLLEGRNLMNTKKINSLTDKQVAQLAIYRDKWLNIGLNTEPTDIPAAEANVKLCYKMAGLTAPQIICTDSPLSSITIDNQINQVSHRVIHRVCNQVTNQVYNQVCNQVYNQVTNQVTHQVWNQVYDRVGDLVSNQVLDQVWNHVWDQIKDRVFWDLMQIPQCYGCHEAGFLSVFDYFREVCGLVKETEEITGLIAMAKCCGWWTPYENIAIIQHRPCFICFDDKRLHYESGMAIKYRDGFGIWAIHGVRVDEQIVIKPHEQTIKQIREEKNAEVKRIRIERFGWNHYLTAINAKVINRRHNDIENTCETLVRTPDGMTILLPTCKTGRLFSLEVPSKISTCEQAQNWLHSGSQLDTIVGKTRVIGRS